MSTENANPEIESLLTAWFGPQPETQADVDANTARWFKGDEHTDLRLRTQFEELSAAAVAGKLVAWESSARGRLALILLCDQLPRQFERGRAAAFAGDPRALELSTTGIEQGVDLILDDPFQRTFFYMPLEHSEQLTMQELSVKQFKALAEDPSVPDIARNAVNGFMHYAEQHREIIKQFGRFPHRNRVLQRSNTAEEQAYLDSGGPSFGQK